MACRTARLSRGTSCGVGSPTKSGRRSIWPRQDRSLKITRLGDARGLARFLIFEGVRRPTRRRKRLVPRAVKQGSCRMPTRRETSVSPFYRSGKRTVVSICRLISELIGDANFIFVLVFSLTGLVISFFDLAGAPRGQHVLECAMAIVGFVGRDASNYDSSRLQSRRSTHKEWRPWR